MSLSLSASTIKSWFQYRCERKTRYEMMPPADLASAGIDKNMKDVGAWASLGNEFELAVVRNLTAGTKVLRPQPGSDKLNPQRTEGFLKGQLPYVYAAQAALDALHAATALQLPGDFSLRRSFPDLIRVDRSVDPPLFTLIDIKATQTARTFHKAQVAFYAVLLEGLLAHLKAPGVVSSQGEIWCIREGTLASEGLHRVDVFDLQPYRRLVNDFFIRDLPVIGAKNVSHSRDETFFHIYYKCEQCQYLPHCIKSIDKDDAAARDVSAVPGLSHEAKKTLLRQGVSQVGQLASAQISPQSSNLNWSLQRRSESLIARAQAQTRQRLHRIPDLASYLMPPQVDVALYLVADYDPVEDNLATLGYLYRSRTISHSVIKVLPQGSRQAEADVLCEVMTALINDLGRIDEHNAQHDEHPEEQLFAHIFLYEPSEAQYLQNAIGRHLDDPRIRQGLLHAVRLFPPEALVPEPEFRGVHHLPATAVRSVFEQLFALPVRVSYDLRQVSQAIAMASPELACIYQPAPPFRREFSSLLAMDVIRALRVSGNDEGTAVEADVEARLEATAALVEWLLAENSHSSPPFLRLSKQAFRFQTTLNPLQAEDLDVLQAYELLETRATMLSTLVRLAQPYPQRRTTGQCLAQLTLLKSNLDKGWLLFKVPPESQESELSADDIALILTNDDPDIRLDPQRWGECQVEIAENRAEHGKDTVFVTLPRWRDKTLFKRWLVEVQGPGWFIDRAYKDVNTPRTQDFLDYLDAD